ncbi:hypothetical protein DVX05_04625 [Enterococcus faecium]|nr:hypothetical protein DVX05_04625 [Enterococcus faecium]
MSLKTLYRKRTVIWPFYFYTIIRTLSKSRKILKIKNKKMNKNVFKYKVICYYKIKKKQRKEGMKW